MRVGEAFHLITDVAASSGGIKGVCGVGCAVGGLGGREPPRGWV